MNRKFIVRIFLTLCLVSCSGRLDNRTSEKKWNDYCDRAEAQIMTSFKKKMWKEKGLEAIGSGGGGDGKHFKMLSITFQTPREMNIPEARALLLETVQIFLSEINKHEEFGPCCTTFPFAPQQVHVTIHFTDKDKRDFALPPSVAIVDIRKGELAYRTHDKKLQRVKEETYEEALQLVNCGDSSPCEF